MELDVLDPPDAVGGAVSVRDLSPGIAAKGRLEMRPGVAGMEGEDGREVVPGCSRQPEPVLLRPGLGALVWPDPLVIGSELDPGQKPAASESRAVRSAVVLLERPDGRHAGPRRSRRREERRRRWPRPCRGRSAPPEGEGPLPRGRHPRLVAIGAWRNLVARGLWVAEVAGSNPVAPI